MISTEHLKIYEDFNGDGDMFVRLGSETQKHILTYEIWKLIEDFIQDLILKKNGLASENFISLLEERLKAVCDNERAILALKSLAEKFA